MFSVELTVSKLGSSSSNHNVPHTCRSLAYLYNYTNLGLIMGIGDNVSHQFLRRSVPSMLHIIVKVFLFQRVSLYYYSVLRYITRHDSCTHNSSWYFNDCNALAKVFA